MKKVIMAVVFCVCLAVASYAIAQCSLNLGAAKEAEEAGDEIVADGAEVADEAVVLAENAVEDAAIGAEEVVTAVSVS